MQGKCRLCGQSGDGEPFEKWVKPTFTNWDKLKQGDVICNDCLFWFEEQSANLAKIVGKDKPQRMRNYSHFIVAGQWTPLSKAHKRKMLEFLSTPNAFPELACIADSGQKHIAFQSKRNAAGQSEGWVQFEEGALWIVPSKLKRLIATIEEMKQGFSESAIESAEYEGAFIIKFGFAKWQQLEEAIKQYRGTLLFKLALFLSQREEKPTEETKVIEVKQPEIKQAVVTPPKGQMSFL